MVAIAAFLNSREKAVFVWGLLLAAYLLRKDRSIILSALGVLRAMFAPKLIVLWAASAIYCAAMVISADQAGMWDTSETKETVYWYLAAGAVLASKALSAPSFDHVYLRDLVGKALRLTIVIEFLVSVYVFPFGVELVLVPAVALLVAMQVVAANDPKFSAVRTLLNYALALIGLGLAAWIIARIVTDPRALWNGENVKAIMITPVLSLALIPFLYVVWRWSRWDLKRTMRRWEAQHELAELTNG